VHPPGLVEQQPGVDRHGRVIAQDVLEHQRVRSRRMGDIAGLRELLGVAEQDEVRPMRDGEG
jgi:hypothetical protein